VGISWRAGPSRTEKIIFFFVQRMFAALWALFGIVIYYGDPEIFLIHLKFRFVPGSAFSILANNHQRQKLDSILIRKHAGEFETIYVDCKKTREGIFPKKLEKSLDLKSR